MAVDYDSKAYLENVDAYWRAANYLSVGTLFLMHNPLLRRELKAEDVKPKPIGHWGTIVPQNFIYAHLNRVIKKYGVKMFYIEGSGHGGQVMVNNSYLDGSYTEIYPEITQDEAGMAKLFKHFSFPGGTASHAAPETPGSLHEGGELGYALSHGVGAILDNPDQIAAVEIGDGEFETGPLAASWFSNRFINPVTDGAVLPIVQVNGFKISNPTMISRMSNEEVTKYFEGLGWKPYFVSAYKDGEFDGLKDHMEVHEEMSKVMDEAIEGIKSIQTTARENNDGSMARWPVIVFRVPKGWTGPTKDLDGNPIENSFRAHQIPIPVAQDAHAPQVLRARRTAAKAAAAITSTRAATTIVAAFSIKKESIFFSYTAAPSRFSSATGAGFFRRKSRYRNPAITKQAAAVPSQEPRPANSAPSWFTVSATQ